MNHVSQLIHLVLLKIVTINNIFPGIQMHLKLETEIKLLLICFASADFEKIVYIDIVMCNIPK